MSNQSKVIANKKRLYALKSKRKTLLRPYTVTQEPRFPILGKLFGTTEVKHFDGAGLLAVGYEEYAKDNNKSYYLCVDNTWVTNKGREVSKAMSELLNAMPLYGHIELLVEELNA